MHRVIRNMISVVTRDLRKTIAATTEQLAPQHLVAAPPSMKESAGIAFKVAGPLIALAIFGGDWAHAESAAERQFTHVLLAPGIAASAPFTVQLRTVPLRLVLRNFVVGQGTAKDIHNENFVVMELQAGHIFTTIAGARQERVPGDFWTLEKGTPITFENPHPNAAGVIRVTSFEPVP